LVADHSLALSALGPRGPGARQALSAFVDADVLVGHLTGDPPGRAARATLRPPTSCC
jgi:hypothetical protein